MLIPSSCLYSGPTLNIPYMTEGTSQYVDQADRLNKDLYKDVKILPSRLLIGSESHILYCNQYSFEVCTLSGQAISPAPRMTASPSHLAVITYVRQLALTPAR
ncbi:hypothetical protein AMECASPLE_020169 [Ameca splendens]|uniref:Uncharacterized protein n=1 Tax=Ameca splendens TaxID=208324 RepID=A0ABV0ZYV2_9TELE